MKCYTIQGDALHKHTNRDNASQNFQHETCVLQQLVHSPQSLSTHKDENNNRGGSLRWVQQQAPSFTGKFDEDYMRFARKLDILENELINGQVPDHENLMEGSTGSPRFPSRICENGCKMCAAEEINHVAVLSFQSKFYILSFLNLNKLCLYNS